MKTSKPKFSAGFTMIEIAISLGIIAFALVAIIGILPTGLTTQRDSKEETWILQDASFLSDCITHSLKGNNVLTNYVDWVRITNSGGGTVNLTAVDSSEVILGLLSTPKYPGNNSTNHVVAKVRGLTGMPSEQSRGSELSFSYLLTVEVTPHLENSTNSAAYQFEEYAGRTNQLHQLTNNLYELKLAFQWPFLPNGDVGNGHYVYRTLVASPYAVKNTNYNSQNLTLYSFQGASFQKAP